MTPDPDAPEAPRRRRENADTGPVQPIQHSDGRIELERVATRGLGVAIKESPVASLIGAALATALLSIAGTLATVAKNGPVTPPGASSVQIETVLSKVELLAKKVDDLAGDMRSIKEADVRGDFGSRLKDVEKFVVQQTVLNQENARESSDRRRNWEMWRKDVDQEVFKKGK